MRKNLNTKIIVILAALAICVFGITGIPHGVTPAALKNALVSRINLGLDLRGGTHLVLQVHVEEAVGATADSDAARIQTELQQAGITVGSVVRDPQRTDAIQIQGAPADRVGDIRTTLNNRYSSQYDITSSSGTSWTLTMKPTAVRDLEQRTLEQAIETIRTRIDSLGVSEPVIQEYNLGSNQILVELPGVDDLARVHDIIQSTARLEIHEVQGGPWPDEAAALQALGGNLPYDSVLLHEPAGTASPNSPDQVYQVKKAPEVAGTDIRDAQTGRNPNTNEPQVVFYLTHAAGDHFADFTGANKGKSLGIVLDNKLREVATIRDQIRDTGTISGGAMGEQQAKDLSMLLRTGALPASISYLQESTIGPSLGADSIREGVMASVVGMLVVMVFMLVYYRGAGINADLALFLNLVILLGFMGYSGSTLTLPGIAGVILTIGMGVDSNVLIFERIREELHAGKSPAAAVDQGFAHAWTTIIDTHVTTIVSAAILFIFGTGPVRGFAVTLTIGLLANLFTAVFVSRVIFDSNLNRKQRGEALSI
ncbi:Protein-export membrane protein SecD [Acidisarcina polymorpha]|uniref:Protein translocase subunit SecD n=1 Tax=Acidisarcina polymorpha TaxID=2211140 RepID=A0A2Z5FYT7_9BACT|nr:protein translocase subunit SecD [Acidisarcina polymorpha]AXC11627.1 Protein-export membrane protein SecD [Acidisarcina polymorpha]